MVLLAVGVGLGWVSERVFGGDPRLSRTLGFGENLRFSFHLFLHGFLGRVIDFSVADLSPKNIFGFTSRTTDGTEVLQI